MGVESSLHVKFISPSSCGHYNVWQMRYRVPISPGFRLLTVMRSSVSQLLCQIRSCRTPTHLLGLTWQTRRNLSEEILWPTLPRRGCNSKRLVATPEQPRFMIPHAYQSRRLSLLSISMVLGIQTRSLRYLPPSCRRAFSCITNTDTLHSRPLLFGIRVYSLARLHGNS